MTCAPSCSETKIQELRDSYYVTFRSANNDSRRQERYGALSFGLAEAQAEADRSSSEEIIAIDRDYKI